MVLLLLSITISNKLHALSLAKRGDIINSTSFFPQTICAIVYSIIKMVKNDRKGNQEFLFGQGIKLLMLELVTNEDFHRSGYTCVKVP